MIPLADALVVAKWLIVLFFCAFAGSLTLINKGKYNILRYSIGKSVGLVGLAAATWILSIFKIAPFSFTASLLLLIGAYLALFMFKRSQIKLILKRDWRLFLYIDVIFIMLFIVGVFLRSLNPAIIDIEKYMDMAILSGLLRHGEGVPIDTWYAPDTINYYYFGHWIIATIAKLSQIHANYAFNLGLPTAMAIAGINIFCIAWSLSKKIWGGAIAVFLALFASNMHPFLSFINGKHGYFFYNSGRFQEQVINEYPLYSFILGDLHAHMLNLMLITAFYGLITLMVLENPVFKDKIIIAIAGGFTGLILATNSFDIIPVTIVAAIVISWLMAYKKINLMETIKAGLWLIACASIFGLIFLASFRTAVGGIALTFFKIPITHIIWQFGIPIMLILISFILYKTLNIKLKNNRRWSLAVIFGISGIILVMLPQIILVKDIYYYQNPPFALANTVFKIWYAAWILIAIAASSMSVMIMQTIKIKLWRTVGAAIIIGSCMVLGVGTVYGVRQINQTSSRSIDGTAYLSTSNSGRLAAINWINENIDGQPMLLQTYGDSYSQKSWASSFTGLPTIIGWRSHEWGWRYSKDRWQLITARVSDVQKLYESQTPDALINSANLLKIGYVLIGPDENAVFKIDQNVFNHAFGIPVYDNTGYKIFKVSS